MWRGEVFVWQRHRQWGGVAGEMRSGQGVWRGRGADVIKKECLAGAPSFDNQKTIGQAGNFLFFLQLDTQVLGNIGSEVIFLFDVLKHIFRTQK